MEGAVGGGSRQISVVIATLGGPSLKSTIEHLNAGSIVPAEIIVAIPRAEAAKAAGYAYQNVKIVPTEVRGQVAQRAAGFRRAAHEFVMQLDDDVVVAQGCLAALVRDIEQGGPRCAVAPSMRWQGTEQAVYKAISPPILSKIFFWLLNGRSGCRPGIVTKAGAEIGLYETPQGTAAVEAEWLPGGCVLHHRANLVLENYFPFTGKAYCEDLIHSYHLRERGVRLVVSREAVAYLDKPAPDHLVAGLPAHFRARRYYVQLSSRSKLRMYLYFLALIVRHVVR